MYNILIEHTRYVTYFMQYNYSCAVHKTGCPSYYAIVASELPMKSYYSSSSYA